MMYREALLMGVVGTILGSLLGVLAAHYLSIAMGTLYQSELPRIELNAYPFLIGAACGLGISLVAAILPSRKASHLSPLEAMRDVLPEEIEGVQWWLTGFGALRSWPDLHDRYGTEHPGVDLDDSYGVGGGSDAGRLRAVDAGCAQAAFGDRDVFLAARYAR